MPARSWRFSTEPCCDFELIVDIDGDLVLLKEWFDAGRDPGLTRWTLAEFDAGCLPAWPGRSELVREVGRFVCEGD